jgi:hypothetical protein
VSAEHEAQAGGTHRDIARRLVADIAARRPDLLEHDGIDLSPTIEQALFGRLRRPRRDPPLSGLRSVLRLCRHGLRAILPRQRPAAGDVVALVVNPAQDRILDPVRRGLAERGVGTFTVYESHARSVRGAADRSCRLVDQLRPTRALRLLAFELRARSGLAAATAGFESIVDQPTATRMRSALAEAIGQAALYATCTDALAETRPALLVGFNEIGRWSRILPAVGRRRGIPTLDVAHAEAVDVEAIEGASYDRYAVFGPRAARVLERAGIEPTAIVQVGAPRFDALIARHDTASPPAGRRIVFASQWLTGAMTADVKRRTVEAAITAAAAAAPCELVIQRHPIERDEIAAEVAATVAAPGVTVRHGQPRDLYEALDGAWLLVTGWSNTVFEAVLSNVPALCINATDRALQMPLVEEGIALGATDGRSAAEAVRTLLSPSAWLDAVERARPALVDHLGPLDGRATERLVELVMDLPHSDRPPPPTPEQA